jgi:FtsP/CotA-like multicopper oxidase with cupredoxin domain
VAVLTKFGVSTEAAPFETPLPIPQLIDAKSAGNVLSLTIGQSTHAYRVGQPVQSFGYSAPVLGPVIRLARGTTTDFTIENNMSRATTVHWHGLVVPSDVDGGPHNTIAPGRRWSGRLHVDQPETTAWFHPHPHGETAEQVYSGLAGMLIVEDGSGERIGLPHRYGIDDLPLVLQDRFFDRNGALVYEPGPMDVMTGYRGDTLIVNGAIRPTASVPAGIVRLRILNGANARFFDLQFLDNRAFHVVASDGGYLAEPVELRRLLIAPGERYELLVDFADGADAVLATGPDQNIPMMGMMRGGAAAAGGDIIKFRVDPAKAAIVTALPKKLIDVPPLDQSMVAFRRQFLLNDMMMGAGMMMGGPGFGRGNRRSGPVMAINGQAFDMERIDVTAKRGTMELWEIGSQMMAHPFHVHGTQFQILTLNGRTPPLHMRGWKDTVLVSREAQILVPLSQPASRERPFMFHCHILEHEDAGMMGQYTCA